MDNVLCKLGVKRLEKRTSWCCAEPSQVWPGFTLACICYLVNAGQSGKANAELELISCPGSKLVL